MREIVLDTETTGLDAKEDRVCEVGCVALVNGVPSGETFQRYINPERDMPEEAFRVHGLSAEFLADFPPFAAIAEELEAFLGQSRLVIHNAAFDVGFLNAEFKRCQRAAIGIERAVDTVQIARRRFPGAPASLDALCRRFGIDNSGRQLHGALKDADLLAQVYLELSGGRQPGLALGATAAVETVAVGDRPVRPPRQHAASDDERARHAAFMQKLSDPLWGVADGATEK